MVIEFDADKDAANQVKHGVSLVEAERLDWIAAHVYRDNKEYPSEEVRYIGYAPLDGRLHAVWFTWRGEVCRVIGMRKANAREVKRYEQ